MICAWDVDVDVVLVEDPIMIHEFDGLPKLFYINNIHHLRQYWYSLVDVITIASVVNHCIILERLRKCTCTYSGWIVLVM